MSSTISTLILSRRRLLPLLFVGIVAVVLLLLRPTVLHGSEPWHDDCNSGTSFYTAYELRPLMGPELVLHRTYEGTLSSDVGCGVATVKSGRG